jgi:hypothetical protein
VRLKAFIALLLLSHLFYASILNVKVVIEQDTPSVSAPVSLISGGVALFTQKTDQNGIASFNVTDGSYFISINRSSIYPENVVLKEVSGNTNITVVRRRAISYANAYGQIYGSSSFENASVSAYQGGRLAKRTSANKDGFFILQFLNEGEYMLLFEAPGFKEKEVKVFLPVSEFVPVYQTLEPASPAPSQETSQEESQAILSSPSQVPQFSLIEVVLQKGGMPIEGAEILVSTPSGQMSAKTNSKGIALVNAAEGGNYTFSYGNQTAITFVVQETPAALPKKPQNQPSLPAQNPVPESKQGSAAFVLIAAGILVAIALAAALVLLRMWQKKKEHKGKHENHKHMQHHKEKK